MKHLLSFCLVTFLIFFSCTSDDNLELNGEMDPEEEEQGQDPMEPLTLLTVNINNGVIDADNRKTYIFLTDSENNVIGDFITLFDGETQKTIIAPEGFNEPSFNMHQIEINDFTEFSDGTNVSADIQSYINIEPATLNFNLGPGSNCNTNNGEFEIVIGNVPPSDRTFLTEANCGIQTFSDASNTTLSVVDSNSDWYFHSRDGVETGYYHILGYV